MTAMPAHRHHWDPFEGSVTVMPSAPPRVRRPPFDSGLVQGILVIVAVIALFAAIGLHLFAGTAAALFAVGVFAASFLALFALVLLGDEEGWTRWLLVETARLNGWTPVALDPAGDIVRAGGVDALYDPRSNRARVELAPILRSRLGQMLPLVPTGFYYGAAPGGMPFWMGVEIINVILLAAPRVMRTDPFGNTRLAGRGINFVIGYRLARNTLIEAHLLAETLGDSRRDFDTESIAFNAAFRVTLTGDTAQSRTRLLQVLTPAFMEKLLELERRYRIQVMVRGRHVFLRGYALVNLRDPHLTAPLFAKIVADLAAGAEGFKHYAE
ncbi:hypothetical protein RDV64_18060 [Acuticoccus sp. MNP-M23]|uniref:hypothetical protein n=1 Tax=Acuticoccus sp. MNP-M23 TaxID=3072793 RepID=UPI0028163E92|nr:hypothetical protein [Acuticoccus sp. MNP-M23]WMS41953.1 hypothetical protein RDV64_18060 [Acuticoccus sp. MNP-M23]